jgi:hypothetical protein
MGEATGLWIGDVPAPGEGDYGERVAAILSSYAARLRSDPVLQQLLAWELARPSEPLRKIDAARSKAMRAMLPALRGGETPPKDVDAPVVNAILLAALHYLTLRGASMGAFAGLPLKTERDWSRVMKTMEALVASAYGGGRKR